MKIINQSHEIISLPDDLLQVIEVAGRTCYKSEDKIGCSAPKDHSESDGGETNVCYHGGNWSNAAKAGLFYLNLSSVSSSSSWHDIHSDKETLAEECLDDLPALADFHTAMNNKAPMAVVRDLARRCKRDIDEDLAMYENYQKPGNE